MGMHAFPVLQMHGRRRRVNIEHLALKLFSFLFYLASAL